MTPTILIADDEPMIVKALARQALAHGLSFLADTTSEHVLELARQHKPAVIILDVNQPRDGRDLLAQLKRDPETRSIKVLVCSARDDPYTRQTCLELGAHDYDVKPFDCCFMSRVARLAHEG